MFEGENPSAPLVRLRNLTVPREGTSIVRFLEELHSCYVHWIPKGTSGRSFPCAGIPGCPREKHAREIEWRAYVAVEEFRQEGGGLWFPAVLEVTNSLGGQLRDRKLVGEIWEVFRVRSEGKHKECSGRFLEAGRPPMVDVRCWVETVCYRLWNTTEVKWGVEPILPPAVSLEARKAPPPASVATKGEATRPCTPDEMREFLRRAREGMKNGKEVKT